VSESAYSLYRLKRTPFHERVAALCLPQNFRRWAGFITVGSYDLGLEREYWAIRDAAALIDISPLMKYLIEGPDAARLLDRITPRNIAKLGVGQVFYTGWCDDEGKLLDDGTITRLGEQSFRLTAAEPSLRWLAMNAVGMQVSVTEVTDQVAALSLQGPKSRSILNRCCERSVDALKFFRMAPNSLQGRSVTISRTGYTGDLGYEIWMDASEALPVWDALMAAGADFGLVPCGILAMDMARVDAGLFMIDVDYTAANHAWIAGQKSSPYEMGLGWTVSLDKPGYFVGRRALEREHREGSAWRLAGLEVDWEGLERLYAEVGLPPQIPSMAVRGSLPVFHDGRQIGYASTSTWSPVLKKYIALAHLERPHYEPGTRVSVEVTVEHHRRQAPATVVALPFYEPEWKKK
jgi:aminomethyltransferase